MKIRKPADFLAGALFLAIGLLALYMAQGYTIGGARRMGPGYFPAMLGALLALLGLVQVVASLGGARRVMSRIAIRPVLFIILAAASFGLLLRPVGLIAAVMAAVILAAMASPQSRPVSALLLAVGLAAGSAIVFVQLLGQPLPLVGALLVGR